MIKHWNIYVEGKFMGMVSCITEQGAIDKFFNLYGSASKYSGISRDNIEAIRA
jgi:hypothetical protein